MINCGTDDDDYSGVDLLMWKLLMFSVCTQIKNYGYTLYQILWLAKLDTSGKACMHACIFEIHHWQNHGW
jgi:hypothetical protein